MKFTSSTSALAALALLLPVGALAQSGSSSGSSSGTGTRNQPTSNQYPSGGSSTTSGANSQYPSTSGTNRDGMSQMSGYHDQQMMLIKEDKLKDKLTAREVRGMKVVDRDGQKVGKVQEVGLGWAMRDGTSSYDSTRTYGTTSSTGTTTSTSSRSTEAGSTTPMTSATGMGSKAGQVTLYIELDNDVGIDGDDLAAIPVSHVQLDREKEQVKLQVSRTDLAAQLKRTGTTSYNR